MLLRYPQFSYPWGANMYYFNPVLNIIGKNTRDLSFEKRRKLINSKKVEVTELLRYVDVHFTDGVCVEFNSTDVSIPKIDPFAKTYPSEGRMILPPSFCHIKEIEALYMDAHDYLFYATKNQENDTKIAQAIGEKRILTDNEVVREAMKKSNTLFGSFKLSTLTLEQKLTIANYLHFTLKCGNGQIGRTLSIDNHILENQYPVAK